MRETEDFYVSKVDVKIDTWKRTTAVATIEIRRVNEAMSAKILFDAPALKLKLPDLQTVSEASRAAEHHLAHLLRQAADELDSK